MLEGHQDAKICPFLAASLASRDTSSSASTGSSWAARCKGAECAWWDNNNHGCAVAIAAHELGQLFSASFLSKSA